jgi:protein required for attachment to host cells
MNAICIAIVDASRARLFTFQRSSTPTGVDENFVEERDLINPDRRRTNDLFSSTRPGVARAGGLQFGLDDHRNEHVDKLDSDFARLVMRQLSELAATRHSQKLILCASPRMLGQLRDLQPHFLSGVEVEDISRDLVKLTPSQLREQLVDYGLLPARQKQA